MNYFISGLRLTYFLLNEYVYYFMNEDILRKIKRCMDLSSSSNENEAAIALKQMKRLMDYHNVTERQVLASEIMEKAIDSKLRLNIPEWMVNLHTTVAQAFECEAIMETHYVKNAELIFIGDSTSVEIASYAFAVLLRQLKKLRTEFIKTHLNRIRKRANKTKMADAYCHAWVCRIYIQCKNLNPNKSTEEKVKAYMSENYEDIKMREENHRFKAEDKKIQKAIQLGYADAENVNLYAGTEYHEKALLN